MHVLDAPRRWFIDKEWTYRVPKDFPQSGSGGILLSTPISGGRMAARDCWIKESNRWECSTEWEKSVFKERMRPREMIWLDRRGR
jgi:hypothetical protein